MTTTIINRKDIDTYQMEADCAANDAELSAKIRAELLADYLDDEEGVEAVLATLDDTISNGGRKVIKPRAPKAAKVYSLEFPESIPMDSFPDVKWRMTKEGPVPSALLSTIANLEYLLQCYGISCRYNEMTKRIDYSIPGMTFTVDNEDNTSITRIKDAARTAGVPVTELIEYLAAIAEKNAYHPVRDWISSAKWDGTSRIEQLCNTLEVAPGNEGFRNSMLRRWLISAVAAAFSTNKMDKFEIALVLQGAQGLGKTSWLLALCSDVAHAAKDGLSLDPDNKDSVMQAVSHWLTELGELDATLRKSDIAKLKAFFSKTEDVLRRPYTAVESHFKRRTAYFATVNGEQFLNDTTGNRRFATVAVTGINFKHGINMQQIWAEVYYSYAAGEQWHLTAEEERMLKEVNKGHEQVNPVDELLAEAFVFDKAAQLALVGVTPAEVKRNTVKLTATQVVKGLGLPVDKKHTNEVSSFLRTNAGAPKKSGPMGRYWELVPRRASNWVNINAA